MIRRPPRSTRTDTLFPYTTLFRSVRLLRLRRVDREARSGRGERFVPDLPFRMRPESIDPAVADAAAATRSEEHMSELQSLMRISYAVFCLKKKKNNTTIYSLPSKHNTHLLTKCTLQTVAYHT